MVEYSLDHPTISDEYSIQITTTLVGFSLLCRRISDVLPHLSDIHAIPVTTNGVSYMTVCKVRGLVI